MDLNEDAEETATTPTQQRQDRSLGNTTIKTSKPEERNSK
jgi:hypothetical protein